MENDKREYDKRLFEEHRTIIVAGFDKNGFRDFQEIWKYKLKEYKKTYKHVKVYDE